MTRGIHHACTSRIVRWSLPGCHPHLLCSLFNAIRFPLTFGALPALLTLWRSERNTLPEEKGPNPTSTPLPSLSPFTPFGGARSSRPFSTVTLGPFAGGPLSINGLAFGQRIRKVGSVLGGSFDAGLVVVSPPAVLASFGMELPCPFTFCGDSVGPSKGVSVS